MTLVVPATFPIPWTIRRKLLSVFFGFQLDPSSRIGLSIIVGNQIRLDSNARIGHFNVIRNTRQLHMEEGSRIGQWNWISASPEFHQAFPNSNYGNCRIQKNAAITSRHYIDCSGGFDLGRFSIIAGVRTTVLSHQIDLSSSVQKGLPVSIGNYVFVGSNSKITPGSRISDQSVIAMGSVVVGSLDPGGHLWAGVPARPMRKVEGLWFVRQSEAVSVGKAEDC